MANRQSASIAQMKVGIFVTIALLLLAAVILQQSWGINWFTRTEKALTYLPDVGGLKPGAPVWLAASNRESSRAPASCICAPVTSGSSYPFAGAHPTGVVLLSEP